MLTLLLTGTLTLAFRIQSVKAGGTIYIRQDGSVEGTDKIVRDGSIFTFIDNIYDYSIVVERNNIVIDGNGYALQGTGTGLSIGIDLSERTNVTVRKTQITNFDAGVWLWSASNNCISENNITANSWWGVAVWAYSDYTNISGNNIANNGGGILLASTFGNRISGNNITANNGGEGILLDYESCGNSISGNNIADNWDGIWLHSSDSNNVCGNNLMANKLGILLGPFSSNNSINGNNIRANEDAGITLSISNNNSITGNNIANNGGGIDFGGSSYNSISGNNITANEYAGIHLYVGLYKGGTWIPTYNAIYHNNFIDNGRQVDSSTAESINVWDDGYPSGGNYWSNYTGVDAKSGPSQDEPKSDGIGDTPYIINALNADRYPLMNHWIPFVTATVDIQPDSLNLRSRLMWITAYVELPAPYSPRCIDVSTVKLNGTVQTELKPITIGDYDGDGVLDMMVKFKGASVMPLLHVGISRLTVTGKVNGIMFEGVDSIKVIA